MHQASVGNLCPECVRIATVKVPRLGRPVATFTIMTICVALYLLSLVLPQINGMLGFMPIAGYFEPWRFVTTAFLHASLTHLAFNMIALYFVGPTLERILGTGRFLVLYFLSALGGSVGSLMWALIDNEAWETWTVGASGAVFGLFAAFFIIQRRVGVDSTQVLVVIGINLVIGFLVPHIAWQAHLGGLLTGGLVAWLLTIRRGRQLSWTLVTAGSVFTGLVVLAIMTFSTVW